MGLEGRTHQIVRDSGAARAEMTLWIPDLARESWIVPAVGFASQAGPRPFGRLRLLNFDGFDLDHISV